MFVSNLQHNADEETLKQLFEKVQLVFNPFLTITVLVFNNSLLTVFPFLIGV